MAGRSPGPEQDVIFDGPITSTFIGDNVVSLEQSLQRIEADDPLRIDTSLNYEFTVDAVIGDTAGDGTSPAETHTVGFSSYDIDGLEILPVHVTRYDSAVDTTLAQELKAGDTEIVLNDATGWSNLGLANTRAIAWYDYADSSGNTYPDFTYTRNVAFDAADGVWNRGAISGNTITLNSPWSGPTLAAGSSVRNASDGTRLSATILDKASVTNSWTTYGGQTTGEWQNGVADATAFRPGTAFIRAAAEANDSTPTTNDRLTLRNFVIRNATPTIASNGSDQVVVDLDVLANDELASSTPVEIINVSAPQFGSAAIVPGAGPNGRDIIRYTSTAWFVGRDELLYTVRNIGTGDEFTTTAHVTIAGNSVEQTPATASTITSQGSVIVGNDRPTATLRDFRDENYDIDAGATLIVNGLAENDLLNNEEDADGDVFTVRLVAGPSYGTLDLNPDGTFEYTADDGFEGTDTFRYEVTDGLYSELAAAFIEVHDTPEELLQTRLTDIGLALHNFHDVYQRFTFDSHDSTTHFDGDKNPHLSWRVHILPFLGFSDLYLRFNLDEPWDSTNNLPLLDEMPDVFRAPGDVETTTTTRFQFIGDENEVGTFFRRDSGYLVGPRLRDFTDGTPNTALVIESGPDVAVPWSKPEDLDFDPANPLAPLGDVSSGIINILFADQSVLPLPSSVDPSTFSALVTLAGDELLDGQTLTRAAIEEFEGTAAAVAFGRSFEEANLKQIGLAMANYHNVFLNYPVDDSPDRVDENGVPKLSWRVHILPYLGHTELFKRFNLKEPWDSATNLPLLDEMPDVFRSFDDASDSTTSRFLQFTGEDAPFLNRTGTYGFDGPRVRDFKDGMSNTILVTKAGRDKAVEWTKPDDIAFDINNPMAGLGELTDGHIRAILGDGTVATLGTDIAPATFSALVTHQGREILDGVGVRAREDRRFGIYEARSNAQSDLKNVGIALHNFHDIWSRLPVPEGSPGFNFDENGLPLLSWRVWILPYLDQSGLYNEFAFDEPWDSPTNIALLDKMPEVFRHDASAWDSTVTQIQQFTGNGAAFLDRNIGGTFFGPRFSDITDGLSNTILAVETGADAAIPWTKPVDIAFDPNDPLSGLGTLHPELLLTLFGDGSVDFVPTATPESALRGYVTRAGGESFNQDTGSLTPGFTLIESDGSTLPFETGIDSFALFLDQKPDSDVVLTVTPTDTGIATVDKSTVTFTTDNWNIPQIVTVAGVDDSLLDGAESTTITVSVDDANSYDDFDSLPDQIVTATTTDDDTAAFTIVESAGNTEVDESATTDSFTVVLDAQPLSDVVLTVVSGDTGEATVDKATLTFTPANWDTAQTVTVTGVDDVTVDGSQTTTITVAIDDASSDDAFDPVADQTLTVTTTDDDVAAFTITESAGNTSVDEAGTSDTFTVVIDAQPLTDVVLTVVSGDTGEATVDQATLTFTSANWNAPQTVTVTGVDDVTVDGAQTTTITVAIDDANSHDAFDPVADQTVAVTTTDDDVAGFTIVESAGNTSVDESGTTDNFTVVLNRQPLSDVVLAVGSADTGEATVDTATLTFTAANWNAPQTVTVTGVNDDVVDGEQLSVVTVSTDDAGSQDDFDEVADALINVTTRDNEIAGFSISQTAGATTVSESGSTDSFAVVLDFEPLSNVVLNVASGDTGETSVDKSRLTFTPLNWDTPQTVTVTGEDDLTVDGFQESTVTISTEEPLTDDLYDAVADRTVTVTTLDDDLASYTVVKSSANMEVSEVGTTETITVVLDRQPLSGVTFSVVSDDVGEVSVDKSMLTFTPSNWNVAQTVTIAGVDDTTVDGPQDSTVTVSVAANVSNDAFDALTDQTVSVTNTDDDIAGFVITQSEGSTAVSESGSTDSFDVALSGQPLTTVVLTIELSEQTEVSINRTFVIFTTDNWDIAQTIVVTGKDDLIIDGEQSTLITMSIDQATSDPAFDNVADQTLTAVTIDNEVIIVSIDGSDNLQIVDNSPLGLAESLTLSMANGNVSIFDPNNTLLTSVGTQISDHEVQVPSALITSQRIIADLRSGNDSLDASALTTGLSLDVRAGSGNDTIIGSAQADTLNGESGNDLLLAGSGDDEVVGGSGNDVVDGGSGNDDLAGGGGFDTLTVTANSNLFIRESTTFGDGIDTHREFEQGLLSGGDGHNRLDARFSTIPVTLMGGRGDDTLLGGPRGDRLDGGSGTDFAEIVGSNITLTNSTAPGFDIDAVISVEGLLLIAETSGSTIDASAYTLGPVTIMGSSGKDTLKGGAGDDLILAGSGADDISGGAGNDAILAGSGADIVSGGDGDDLILGGRGNDILSGENGDDLILGGTGKDVISGGAGEDGLFGGRNSDTIRGGANDDFIFGSAGRDVLDGESGQDTLFGNSGRDSLFGGPGDDVLNGVLRDDSFNQQVGGDTLNGAGAAPQNRPWQSDRAPETARFAEPDSFESNENEIDGLFSDPLLLELSLL